MTQTEAERLYHRWLADHLDGHTPAVTRRAKRISVETRDDVLIAAEEVVKGSLLAVASDVLVLEQTRTRKPDESPRRGTITQAVFTDRRKHLRDFLSYLNDLHGPGFVARMRLAELSMADVEGYNLAIAAAGFSASQVNKRMQMVKRLIDRAGRPEHGGQVLQWNWEARDVAHGRNSKARQLPTIDQLQKLLSACDLRERAIIWTAIGLGFGQKDLAALRVGQIDAETYDLRRGKTGIERYGETPPRVWATLSAYVTEAGREPGSLMFITRTGQPLVHGRNDAVLQWWTKLRPQIGESKETLQGFYILRHLGATEFGSRPGCSIGAMKRWLGHSASSSMADVYMKPVTPESKAVVEWVRERLASQVAL
ncbi:MAG: site-specific integrase [Planctomycetota bacterium]